MRPSKENSLEHSHREPEAPSITTRAAPDSVHELSQTPSNSACTISLDRTTKYANVAMMISKGIVHNKWSVRNERFIESHSMSVWHTLEFLSGINARKHYYYDGYNDSNNAMCTFAPSWNHNNSIAKNTASTSGKSKSAASGKYTTTANSALETNNKSVHFNNGAVHGNGLQGSNGAKHNSDTENASKKTQRRRRIKPTKLDPDYAFSPSEYTDLIKCTFNLPRISAALERLMGTNVVRLTDRNFMKQLRERIEEDYRTNLQKRIKARELKEIERERILIIEGKTNEIPAELANDPIFMVDKKAHLEISKTRARLKTNREKNSNRLKLQGVKWERERLRHEQEEAERLNILRQRYKEQKELEEKYKNEDAVRGMDLLRIDDEEWRSCEELLKEFLEQERSKMKERSLRVSLPFTTDPKDVNNILKARKKFREAERRIRKAIEDKHQEKKQQKHLMHQHSSQVISGSRDILEQNLQESIFVDSQTTKDFFDIEDTLVEENVSNDDDSDISSHDSFNEGSSISVAKQRYAEILQQEMDNDVAVGHVISKDQYDHLPYEDEKIMKLRNAKDIRELYQLAEDIIIGERVEGFMQAEIPTNEKEPPQEANVNE